MASAQFPGEFIRNCWAGCQCIVYDNALYVECKILMDHETARLSRGLRAALSCGFTGYMPANRTGTMRRAALEAGLGSQVRRWLTVLGAHAWNWMAFQPKKPACRCLFERWLRTFTGRARAGRFVLIRTHPSSAVASACCCRCRSCVMRMNKHA